MDGLILGVLDTSAAIADRRLAVRARSLTLDGTRFKRPGPIVEGSDLGDILRTARERGGQRCLVQAYGHVLAEEWRPAGAPERDALSVLTEWFPDHGVMAAARRRPDGKPEGSCWLVDLPRWEEAGHPDLAAADLLPDFPAAFYRGAVHLRPEDPAAATVLSRLLGAGLADLEDPALATDHGLDEPVQRYLAGMRHLVGNLPRGVFVWNIEPYDDIETPPEDFSGPLSALYSVAAGLKPNRLLETHGFTDATRVVYFDYSLPGLGFRRLLVEDWDGRDYPSFLRRLFARLPASEAHYCLWEGQTPDRLDWDAVAARWQEEIDAWGGASVLARHWARYRRLSHRFVPVNLLADRGALVAELADGGASANGREGGGDAAIWWSNAFFSVVSNWFHPTGERRAIYRAFLDELATAAPRLWLYGASSDNVAVNAVQAAEYRDWFTAHGGDELEPGRLHRCELLF